MAATLVENELLLLLLRLPSVDSLALETKDPFDDEDLREDNSEHDGLFPRNKWEPAAAFDFELALVALSHDAFFLLLSSVGRFVENNPPSLAKLMLIFRDELDEVFFMIIFWVFVTWLLPVFVTCAFGDWVF